MSDKLNSSGGAPPAEGSQSGGPARTSAANHAGTSAGAKTPENPAKVAFASFVGTAIEWYDYFLFGTAAVLVLNDQFFPSLSPVASQLSALATFAVAFIARPVGGLVFGHFGDRIGRKQMLVLSLLMMGGATVAIGLLPGYTTIGVAAPILLVVLRLIQGFGVGGEWGGAVLMAVEHAPRHKRAFYGSWPQAGVPAGSLLSSGAFFLVQMMPEEQFLTWGWRIPFLVSALLVLVGFVIRLKLEDSPDMQKMHEDESHAVVPALEMFRDHKHSLLVGIFTLVGSNTLFYLVTVYLLALAPAETDMSRGTVLLAIAFGSLLDIIAIPLVAIFADQHGKKKMLIIGSIVTAAVSVPIFALMMSGQTWAAYVAMVLAFPIGHSFVYATSSGFIAELFEPRVRYTGASISYQLCGLISSAPAPLISTTLFAATGSWVPVALYMAATQLIAAVFVATAKPKDEVKA